MNQMSIQQAIESAVREHRAGNLLAAEAIYRQILAAQPDRADVLYLLGTLSFQMGHWNAAIDLLRRAISIRPDIAEYHANLGEVLRASGRHKEAIIVLRQATALNPEFADAHFNLGIALQEEGQLPEAIAAYRQALALRPQFPQAWLNLGEALRVTGQLNEAIAMYRQLLAVAPNMPEVWNNLGNALRGVGDIEAAVEAYQRGIELRPDFADAQCNLGLAFQDQGKLDAAIDAFRLAIATNAGFADAHNNLGTVLHDSGRFEEAIASFRQAVALRPDWHLAHHNLGIASLLLGDFENGWPEYEWRSAVPGLTRTWEPTGHLKWDGSELNGRRIVVYAEQGRGDAIQFARYLPMVAARGGKVVVRCREDLVRLMCSVDGVEQVLPENGPLPESFDVYCSLMSLPFIFGTNLNTIPANIPYLRADVKLAGKRQTRLAAIGHEMKVGLVWSGGHSHQHDKLRSMTLETLAPLAAVPGVAFVSLQKGEAASQAQMSSMSLIDWTAELYDFADTAALIQNLDLVISVDTAVAHLAGAMGKPVWVLLPKIPDWRWLLDREDSPWYPTMRLFRQRQRGNWDEPVRSVAEALRASCGRHNSLGPQG